MNNLIIFRGPPGGALNNKKTTFFTEILQSANLLKRDSNTGALY